MIAWRRNIPYSLAVRKMIEEKMCIRDSVKCIRGNSGSKSFIPSGKIIGAENSRLYHWICRRGTGCLLYTSEKYDIMQDKLSVKEYEDPFKE